MNRILSGFLAMLFALLLIPAMATPANAGTACTKINVCGYLSHYSPDNGYDKFIVVSCDWGNDEPEKDTDWVYEGENSRCVDVDGVYVRNGEEISCRHWTLLFGFVWDVEWDSTGWHQLHAWNRNKAGSGCVVGLD